MTGSTPSRAPGARALAPTKTPVWKRLWQWVRTPWDIIKIFKSLLSVVSAAMVILNIVVAGSIVLKSFMLVFGAGGILAGYFLTVGFWKDKARAFRRKVAALFVVLWFVTILGEVVIFTALDATIARDYESIALLHNLMVDFAIATDFLLGILVLVNFYSLVASFTLVSPGMDKGA